MAHPASARSRLPDSADTCWAITDNFPMNASTLEFDPFSAEFFNDPYPVYQRLRDEAPVYYSEQHNFYALSRHGDVAAAFKDYETYSSARGVTLDQVSAGTAVKEPMVQFMDPPAHRRMRGLVNKVFTPRAVAALEPIVRTTIDRYLSRLDPDRFDVVADFSAFFPVEVITKMLGVPEDDRQSVRHWQDLIMERPAGKSEVSEAGKQAMMKTGLLYYNLIQQRRADPQDDMISGLIAAEVQRDDGTMTSLDDVEIAGFCMLLGGAGAETVTSSSEVPWCCSPSTLINGSNFRPTGRRSRLPSRKWCASTGPCSTTAATASKTVRCTV